MILRNTLGANAAKRPHTKVARCIGGATTPKTRILGGDSLRGIDYPKNMKVQILLETSYRGFDDAVRLLGRDRATCNGIYTGKREGTDITNGFKPISHA